MDKKLVFYVEGQTSIIDTIDNKTGLSFFFKRNIEECQKEYPGAEIVPFDYALDRINEALKEKFPMLRPTTISEEAFFEMFECLPPMQYKSTEEGMSFKMSEMTFGDITSGYVKKNGNYYQMNCRIKTKHEEMLAVCKNAEVN